MEGILKNGAPRFRVHSFALLPKDLAREKQTHGHACMVVSHHHRYKHSTTRKYSVHYNDF